MPPVWLRPSTIRRSVDAEIFVVLLKLDDLGWKLSKQGHGYRVYCPCDTAGRGVAVPSSSGRKGSQARRLLRNAEHCPDSHELMK